MTAIVIASPLFLAALTASRPGAVGIAVVGLSVIYLAFKVTKFAIKILLLIAAVTVISLAVRGYFAAH